MDKVLSLLGLIYRARKMLLGEDVLNNLEAIKLIIIASDISDKSKIRYVKKCEYYKIQYIDRYNSEELSKAIGKNNIKVIGITDEGFKKSLLEKL